MRCVRIAIISLAVLLISPDVFSQHHHPPKVESKPAPVKKKPVVKKSTAKPKKTIQVKKDSLPVVHHHKDSLNKQLPVKAKDTSIISHQDHGVPTSLKKDTIPKTDSLKHHHDMMNMSGTDSMQHNVMNHAYSRNLPMNRNGSGTSWNPDESPMYMGMTSCTNTDWMFHGSLFIRYTNTDIFNSGVRGANAIGMPNWFMTMMNRRIGQKGLFNATVMISLDRLTEGGDGYPLLFQSGETWQGKPLVDRQHPHDFFSGLSIGYTQMLNKHIDIFAYFGYPGEPALGATAFMHRPSAMNNPDAPLGHHWQDATHITFGVGTLGLRYKNFKLEGSIFTGREPDENRFDFDKTRFDSYSYRLSYNPSVNWALQFSQGFIESPEALKPDEDVKRTSASVLYAKQYNGSNHLSGAVIWGLNNISDDHREHSILAEGNYQQNKNAYYTRYEFIQKSSEELALEAEIPDGHFNIHALTAGFNRTLASFNKVELIAGSQLTAHSVGKELKTIYGTAPISFQLYLQLRPLQHQH